MCKLSTTVDKIIEKNEAAQEEFEIAKDMEKIKFELLTIWTWTTHAKFEFSNSTFNSHKQLAPSLYKDANSKDQIARMECQIDRVSS